MHSVEVINIGLYTGICVWYNFYKKYKCNVYAKLYIWKLINIKKLVVILCKW